nr:hypothetical protein HEP87_51105 [Streptomyces sp. S1D4-11]
MKEPTGGRRVPRYKPTLVDPYRDHLRARRAEDPAVPVLQLFRKIKELGYTGSLNLLYRYIAQGRAEGDKPVTTPQHFARLLLTRPENLRDKDTALLRERTEACTEMSELARLGQGFAPRASDAESGRSSGVTRSRPYHQLRDAAALSCRAAGDWSPQIGGGEGGGH